MRSRSRSTRSEGAKSTPGNLHARVRRYRCARSRPINSRGMKTRGDKTHDPRAESALRHHFRKLDDPYAGADRERAVRLSGALWVGGAILVLALLPVAPPTAAVGSAGWAIAAAMVLGALAAAARCFGATDRVGYNELLATSYAALLAVATMEWLAGGRAS